MTWLALVLAAALQQVPATHQARIAWVPNPRTTDGTWVSDGGHHLRADTRDSLNALIGRVEAATGAEIAVVVVDSLAGLTEQEFALAIHRGWGVGKKDADNGVVLLWAPNDRAVFISVGYGLEGAIPDRLAGRIRDQEIISAFRAGDFDRGIVQGVNALASAIAAEHAAGGSGGPNALLDQDRGHGREGRLVLMIMTAAGGSIATLFGGIAGVRRYRRRRPRPCPKCGTRMTLLGEQADDAYLDEGAKAEERVKSIDWDVWVCPSCAETVKVPFRKWFSSYVDCPQCRRRTAKATGRRQLRAPTTSSTGLAEVSYRCANCTHAWTATETIAQLSSSSGSSGGSGGGGGGGGGGSSFGGGSAGGGGAGGHY